MSVNNQNGEKGAQGRLRFERSPNENRVEYNIFNAKGQYLGDITKTRVGRFMHWCFFPDANPYIGDMWFTNRCLKEISAFITKLYREDD